MGLTKPRVVALLLLTTLVAMLIAGDTMPPARTILLTLAAGYLAAGGAGAINCYLDSDLDALMSRTCHRPIPSQRVEPGRALAFGLVLSLLSVLTLAIGVNLISAALAAGGALFYLLVYTIWLKRRSTQNIVIGGIAGAFPPLVGWAAATGALTPAALLLSAIICCWTPPHFWALALVRREDYARAGVPMLPVVRGDHATRVQILWYSLLMSALAILPIVLGLGQAVYAAVAVGLSSLLIYLSVSMLQRPSAQATWRFYRFSLVYLALLFTAMLVDGVLRYA